MIRISKLIILIVGITLLSRVSYAEQSGSSPDSGTGTSVLNTGYSWLVAKGINYGATQPADWTNNWGTSWNRIMYSAFWEPDGTATEADVVVNKTFYSGNNNRTIRSGTANAGFLPTFSLQQYVQYDNAHASDYQGEESTWSSPATNVWIDTRTDLYWSNMRVASASNPFTIASCDFFTTTPRSDYGNSSTDPDCGVAINMCAVLDLASGGTGNTDWYLPSQAELMQAYIDGMYNQSTFTDMNWFWSSTEYTGNNTYAWVVGTINGYTYYYDKTGGYAVRCARRD